jgi:hypothetical protein
MKAGDKFYINIKPKNFPHLYGKELTVGMVWNSGDIWPLEEFCSIEPKYISRTPPQNIKWGLLEKIKFLFSNPS